MLRPVVVDHATKAGSTRDVADAMPATDARDRDAIRAWGGAAVPTPVSA